MGRCGSRKRSTSSYAIAWTAAWCMPGRFLGTFCPPSRGPSSPMPCCMRQNPIPKTTPAPCGPSGSTVCAMSSVKAPTAQIAPERLVTAQVQSIDHLCRTSEIGIIHLDVEGYETPALEGALETIRRCRPIIIVETKPADAWLKANLAPLGYKAGDRPLEANTVFSTV
ncbi:MAG: FkbM family methyltransferase [Gammaproteobacteria bacterium]|nr:MAG: FkbM family methyltransferase [Gammaproteobacteria bacterium]